MRRNSNAAIWKRQDGTEEKKERKGYKNDGKDFIIIKNGKQVGCYTMDRMVSVIVKITTKKNRKGK